jgi:hypothetical protein
MVAVDTINSYSALSKIILQVATLRFFQKQVLCVDAAIIASFNSLLFFSIQRSPH